MVLKKVFAVECPDDHRKDLAWIYKTYQVLVISSALIKSESDLFRNVRSSLMSKSFVTVDRWSMFMEPFSYVIVHHCG